MLIRCCNSGCEAPYDHSEGRLIRFSRLRVENSRSEKTSVEHFWLCGACARLFVFERNASGDGVTIKARDLKSTRASVSRSVPAS
jgi:hypothetical protein